MHDYRSGYGNGKALGHAMHNEEALAAIRAPVIGEPDDYMRGCYDGFLDGWEAWQQEVTWMAENRMDLVHQSWEQHLGKRYKPPESEATR